MDSERKPPPPADASAYDYERMPVQVGPGTAADNTPTVTDGQVVAPLPVARRRKSVLREYVEAIAIAILLALVIRTLIVQAFTIPSGSMMDTLLVGDYILVNKFLYGPEVPLTDYRLPALRTPNRGDIIVFKYPQDEKRDFIKRIVATPGESVQVRGQQVFINGNPLDEPYVRRNPNPLGHSGTANFCGYAYACDPVVVPPDSYFVMGDNRDNSQDSRYWGFVKRDKIKGKAFLIYWSWDSDRHWLRWWRLGNYIP
jgi:signal peptidase I